jgi:dTDP-4-dehydrorhamnose reductase
MTDAPAILVVGGDGLVGGVLAAHLRARGDRVVETSRRNDRIAAGALKLDLAADPASWPELPPLKGAVLCAAIARLQDCEQDPRGSWRVNVEGVAALARRLTAAGVATVFLSTDKVYDGTRAQRRREEPTCPTTEYGRQKAAAEAAMPAEAAILRLSKVVSATLPLFAGWSRDLAAGRPITPFSDLMMAPVPVELVVKVIARLIDERRSGLFHLTGARDVNYVEAARVLAETLGCDPGLVQSRTANVGVVPVPYTALDMSLERSLWGLAPPEPDAVLRQLAVALAAPPGRLG